MRACFLSLISISLAAILFDTAISLPRVFFLPTESFIVLVTIINKMGRYARMIVALILSPFLSRMLNVWTMLSLREALAVDTQMYLWELLGLEERLDFWIFGSLVLSFILFDRA